MVKNVQIRFTMCCAARAAARWRNEKVFFVVDIKIKIFV